jgi:hypothetical protein
MERREFTVLSALALLGGATITVSGCGGGGNPMSGPTTGDGSVGGTISANHGHVATISAAELTGGGGLNLDIRGTADHTHTVALTGSQVVDIRGGATVAKQSTDTAGHDHMVTFDKGSGTPGSGPGY